MEALDLLKSKLEALLKKYSALEADNARLRATIEGQNKAIQKLNKKISIMDSGMVSVQLGATTINEDDKENMRRQLDTVLADIDNILNTLND